MRLLLWLVALMALAIGIAVTARFNPGNVVLFYPPHRIDLSLNFVIVIELLLFALVYALLRAFSATVSMPARVAAYRQRKRERDSNKGLRDALKALFEGRFGHAEKAAARAADLPENAGLAALIGARAAHRMREPARRDTWLAGIRADAALKTARLMTVTELMVDDHKPEAALEAVAELNASGIRHIHALQWSMRAHQQAKNWPEVLRLVRSLDKHKALHPALSAACANWPTTPCCATAPTTPSRSCACGRRCRRPTASSRISPRARPHALNERGLFDEARATVEEALADDWDDRVVRAYRDAAAPAGTPALLAQIEKCEQWLRQRPNDAELALTLGALCLKQKLWGKAQRYLEQALSDATEAAMVRECHLKLAQMHEALGQQEQAAAHYRQCAWPILL